MSQRNHNDIFLRDLRALNELSNYRSSVTIIMIVVIILVASFLIPFHASLVSFQLPSLIGSVILFSRPSLVKILLIQQYTGMASIVVSLLKSLFLVFFMLSFIIVTILDEQANEAHNSGGTKPIFVEIYPRDSVFPRLISIRDQSNSPFVGLTLAIYGAIMSLLELLSMYLGGIILIRTYKVIKLVKSLDTQPLYDHERSNQTIDIPNDIRISQMRQSRSIVRNLEIENSHVRLNQNSTIAMGHSFEVTQTERGEHVNA